jgi:ABC-type oligopeptide transport system substrate-binding subunit/class 3 adenylate cyclase
VPKEYAERLLATRGQVRGERRIVTILFSDVKGSTAMAEGLDPEDWAEIMEGAFNVLIEPIYRYEGTLARLMGDAILAFFGAPIAHEDDPERACRAALDIVDGAQRYATRLEEERGITGFNVRVGINTGLVVVGEIGSDLRVEYTAMGDAVNLAARMESAAEPGTVLIAEATHKLIAGLFDTDALGPIEVKGRRAPVPVYRVLAAKAAPGKPRGIIGLESPLVGREAECAALREALERLQAGVGGIVTLVGEAGIGKSRVVAELRKQAPPDVQWVEGRCLSYGTSVAYLLWVDVLRCLLGATLEESPKAVREALRQRVEDWCPDPSHDVYPYLARLMALPLEDNLATRLDDMDGQNLKANTFSALETVLQCAASEGPLVLVCEDLHWADATSLGLLEQLLALTDHSSLLLICIFRPVKEHGSWRIKETAARTYGHRHADIQLKPLSATHSELLVGNLLQIEDLAPALKERMLAVAEGNPFYVEEIIRSLVDQNAISRDDATGRWVATETAADVPIPDTLHGVLLARIDRLQEETKRVLQMASVIGRIFLYRVLAAIAEQERRLDEHLLALQREEMIRERARIPELEYIFKHELTREAAYNGLLKVERRLFHRLVAQALERLLPDRIEEQLGLLAHHWERARDAQKATHYLVRAGDQARDVYAHHEAINYYERALALLKEQKEHERAAQTLMKLGLTYHTAFDFQRSRRSYEEGFGLWQRAAQARPAATRPPATVPLRVPWYDHTLDPAMTGDIQEIILIRALFGGLVQRSPEMDVVPDIARSWEMLEGGRKYVFHLRDDVRWSDGTALTASDFEYAWKRVLHPATQSPVADLLYDIKGARAFHSGAVPDPSLVGVQAHDDGTLVVTLEGPTAYFLHVLGHTATSAVPRHVVEAHGDSWTEVGKIATSGPFRLEAFRPGEFTLLVRNPAYRGLSAGNVQELKLCSCWLAPEALDMYESDELDMLLLWGLSLPNRERAMQRHAEEYVSLQVGVTWGVQFNASRPPFDDRRVRRALAMALDREPLERLALRGSAYPATGGFLPAGLPGHSPGLAVPYDPRRARQLLAEAGYPRADDFPPIDAVMFLDAEHYAEYLQAQWQQNLKLKVAWNLVDGPTYWATRSLSQACFAGWGAAYPDPHSMLGRPRLKDQGGWRHEGYDRLIEEARRTTDQEERIKLYRQADRILVEEAAVIPLTYGRVHMLIKPWVRKHLLTMTMFYWKDLIIDPH